MAPGQPPRSSSTGDRDAGSARLAGNLQRLGVEFSEHNIWESAEAAAFVRSVARGNETVPTVRIGNVALVNPSPDEVVAAIAAR